MVWRLGGLSLSSCSAASNPTPDPPLAPQKLQEQPMTPLENTHPLASLAMAIYTLWQYQPVC